MKKLLLVAMLFSLMACEKSETIEFKTVNFIDKSGIDFTYCEFETEEGLKVYSDEEFNAGVIFTDVINRIKFRLIDNQSNEYIADIDIVQDCTIEFYYDSNGMSFKYYYN